MPNYIFSSYDIVAPHELNDITKFAIYNAIERAGRTCYKSEDNMKMTMHSAAKFVQAMVKNGHHAMLEHAKMTVIFTVDRGVTHELVRHRVASYAQESTRYCNYSKNGAVTFICPSKIFTTGDVSEILLEWYQAATDSERHYLRMLELGATPEQARTVLITSTKADIVLTANMREWRHIFELRAAGTTGKPHPQMLEVMVPLLQEVAEFMPELFGDIWDQVPDDVKSTYGRSEES